MLTPIFLNTDDSKYQTLKNKSASSVKENAPNQTLSHTILVAVLGSVFWFIAGFTILVTSPFMLMSLMLRRRDG